MTGEEMRCLMWGRESINTPIKVKGKKIDPLLDPKGPSLTGAFEGALTAALDVISLTHEVDLNGASQGLNLASVQEIPPVKNKTSLVSNVNNVNNVAASNILSQLTGPQMPSNIVTKMVPATSSKIPNPTAIPTISGSIAQIKTDDPLRDLVLFSKMEEPKVLNELAIKAANLQAQEVIVPASTTSNVKSLAGIFAGTENFVKKVEETVKKKYAALDPSDSEGYGEIPLLGRVSRTKRAKSATQRRTSGKLRGEKRRLLKETESSSTDTVPNSGGDRFNEPDYVEDRMKQVKDSLINEMDGKEYESLRPINIDIAMGFDAVCGPKYVTSGNEVCSKTKMNNFNENLKRKKRPKTAKHNRVSPAVDSATRKCQSAGNKNDSDAVESDNDPLEPWSTKGIASMSKILAWENDPDSI